MICGLKQKQSNCFNWVLMMDDDDVFMYISSISVCLRCVCFDKENYMRLHRFCLFFRYFVRDSMLDWPALD